MAEILTPEVVDALRGTGFAADVEPLIATIDALAAALRKFDRMIFSVAWRSTEEFGRVAAWLEDTGG